MLRNALIVTLCALLLGGCAHHRYSKRTKLETRQNPQVKVESGTIQVPEILYFFPNEKEVKITWQLPAGGDFRFPADGIRIQGALTDRVVNAQDRAAVVLDPDQKEIECPRQQKEERTFSCINHNTKPGIYKYVIKVLVGGRELTRDPPIVNMPD